MSLCQDIRSLFRPKVLYVFGTEAFFVVLPLWVLWIVKHYQGQDHEFFGSAEWSFATAVLFGLGLVRLGEAVAIRGGREAVDHIGFRIAFWVVPGLVPSIVILVLALVSPPLSRGWIHVQEGWFAFGLIALWHNTHLKIWADETAKPEPLSALSPPPNGRSQAPAESADNARP